LSKGCQKVGFPFINKKLPTRAEQFEIELRQRGKLSFILISLSLAGGKIDQKIEMAHITFAQQLVLQHAAQRWRERHRDLERDVVVNESLHHLQKRDISLRDGLEEPVLLEEMLMLGMPNERKMRV